MKTENNTVLTTKPSSNLPIRWRSMKKKPKSKGNLWIRGDDGKHYAGYFEKGSLFTKAPG